MRCRCIEGGSRIDLLSRRERQRVANVSNSIDTMERARQKWPAAVAARQEGRWGARPYMRAPQLGGRTSAVPSSRRQTNAPASISAKRVPALPPHSGKRLCSTSLGTVRARFDKKLIHRAVRERVLKRERGSCANFVLCIAKNK